MKLIEELSAYFHFQVQSLNWMLTQVLLRNPLDFGKKAWNEHPVPVDVSRSPREIAPNSMGARAVSKSFTISSHSLPSVIIFYFFNFFIIFYK